MSSVAGHNRSINQIPEINIAIFRATSYMCITVCKAAVCFKGLQGENNKQKRLKAITLLYLGSGQDQGKGKEIVLGEWLLKVKERNEQIENVIATKIK